jgi:prepilin-type N-terminal cleavage/methylation domain-containing protein
MVARRFAACAGFTLMELMIASILLAVVLLSCTSIYITANRFLDSQERRWQQLGSFLAMEHMARRIPLSNDIQVNSVAQWIKVRWDYRADYSDPLNTPNIFTGADEDRWLKYGIICIAPSDCRLRWRVDTTAAADVSAADAEVEANLVVDGAGSSFVLTGPLGGPPTLDIRLRTIPTPGQFITQQTGLLLRCRSEN